MFLIEHSGSSPEFRIEAIKVSLCLGQFVNSLVESKILTSIQNPLIKQIRKLHRSKERRKQSLLLLEGTNLVTVACQVNYGLNILLCTPRWQENNQQLYVDFIKKGLSIRFVSEEILKAIATTVNPDGVVAIAPRQIPLIPNIQTTQLSLGVERLQDPGNLGTIIRTAVAGGVDSLWLSADSVDVDNPKVLRASVGEWFKLPMATGQNLAEVVKQHQQRGIQIIATTSQATKNYWEIDFCRPSLILLGNEGAGLSSELIALADEKVIIPLSSDVESLNVAIATALLVYEAKRQLMNK
ncbi:MAG: RNA methyltransferase [Pleurocapsa sp.]